MTRLRPTIPTINRDKLHEEFDAAFGAGAARHGYDGAHFVDTTNESITLQQVQTVIDAHNPANLTTQQQEVNQAATAGNVLKALMAGLHGLSAADKGYALYGRIFASRNGASQPTIDGITDKASAVAYITGLAQWQAMTAASRAFFAMELEANAGMCMVLLLVLT